MHRPLLSAAAAVTAALSLAACGGSSSSGSPAASSSPSTGQTVAVKTIAAQAITRDLRDVASVRLVGATPGDVLEARLPADADGP